MSKTSQNLALCSMIFAVALVISNIIAAKTILTGIVLFDTPVIVPSAVICYCVTFLITDVVGEIWGPDEASQIVKFGFICQLIACCFIAIATVLPASDPAMQSSFQALLGQNFIFVIASLLAYLSSQSWDVFIFHALRKKMHERGKSDSWRWVWNNVSTMSSQIIDTFVYIFIAFGLGMGWLFEGAMIPVLLAMMLGQYLCKLALAALDTPVFYLLTHKATKRSELAPISQADM